MLRKALLLCCLILAPWVVEPARASSWATYGPTPPPPLAGVIVYGLANEPGAGHLNVYAGTTDGVYRSTDGGLTWTAVNNGIPTRDGQAPPNRATVLAIAADPQGAPGAAILFAGTDVGPGPFGTGPQLYRSTDGGASWQPTALPHVMSGVIAIVFDPTPVADPATQRTMYVGTVGAGVFKSTDGGQSFTAVNAGLPGMLMVHALAVAPSAPGTLYVSLTTQGVFKSTDGGLSWQAARAGLEETGCPGCAYRTARGIAVDPIDANVVYAATNGGGAFKSVDGGTSWSPITNGLGLVFMTAIAIDPSAPATVYGAGTDDGVYVSHDAGASWSAFNEGLTNRNIQSFLVDATEPALLAAGSSGSGVFIRETSEAGVAELSITKSATPASVDVGQTLTYILTVTNAGPSTATNVQVVDPLPSAVSFLSATTTAGSCTQAAGTVSCAVPSLAVGAPLSISITVAANVAGAFTNTASVSADETDPDTTNDSGSAVVTVTAVAQPQTVTFGPLAPRTFGEAPFTVSATASSGLPVSFSASGNCTVAGALVSLTGAGSCAITASQGGNATYAPAPPVTRTFPIAQGTQTIAFAPIADRVVGDPPFAITASASSGLPVSFAVVSGPATISGATVTLTGAGSVVIRASQAGDANWAPAPSVDRGFEVTEPASGGRGALHGTAEVRMGSVEHRVSLDVGRAKTPRLRYERRDGRGGRERVDRFELTAVTSMTFSKTAAGGHGLAARTSPDTVTLTGVGTWDGVAGYTVEARATDAGEPGRGRDRVTLVIRAADGNVLASVDGLLTSGNIQATPAP